jgi:hypothetical protein
MGEAPLVEPKPADRCTFRRPFAPDFHECPAFEAVEYGVTDLEGRPMEAIITCAHLAIGVLARFGSSYPRCLLGAPADRAAFAAGGDVSSPAS